ncbi:hypothetical protein BDP27DRAFT_1360960 [Rhodocollybia butyracea]|uniref:Secreted protein n=1 Tax=Rhodocollybia butyracea TaxID=206335 RepID=A0A9P5Q0X5_9AGAR|nr:hypothetical protein BDP27DRAFT_1360960 [Rhodocollybia butyracea]
MFVLHFLNLCTCWVLTCLRLALGTTNEDFTHAHHLRYSAVMGYTVALPVILPFQSVPPLENGEDNQRDKTVHTMFVVQSRMVQGVITPCLKMHVKVLRTRSSRWRGALAFNSRSKSINVVLELEATGIPLMKKNQYHRAGQMPFVYPPQTP